MAAVPAASDSPAPPDPSGSAAALWLGAGAAVAACAWLVAPSVAWFDSGELAGAAVQLGVPHPTGFAAFCLGGHAAARLPLGSAALRVHLLGAACAVAAVALWLRPADRRTGWSARAGDALAAGLACALPLGVPALAMHMRAAEVYPPAWLLAAACVAAWAGLQGGARLHALAVAAGLGAGVHVEAAGIGGAFWLAAAWQERHRPAAIGRAAAVGLACAAAVLAYLPLAARRLPLLSWGDVQTADALWQHLTAATIRRAFAERMGIAQGWQALGALLLANGKWLLAPAALGAAAAWRTDRPWLLATAAVAAIDALFSAVVNPMGLRDQQAGLLLLLCLAVLAARIAWHLPAWPRVACLAALTVALQFAAPAAGANPDLLAGGRYADTLLARAAPARLLVTASDHAGSACAWLQGGEGVRPDAACVPGVFFRDDRQLRQQAAAHDRPQWAAAANQRNPQRRLQAWLAPELRAAPVSWQTGLSGEDAWASAALVPGEPWSELRWPLPLPADATAAARQLPASAAAVCAAAAGDPQCRSAPTLAGLLAAELAVHAAVWSRRDPPLGLALAEAAVRLWPSPKALNNLASMVVAADPARALQLAERALQIEPDYARAHRSAARACLRLRRVAAAVAHAEAAAAAIADRDERALWLQQLLSGADPADRGPFAAMLGL